MNESKELLEATIKGLQEKVNQLNTELTTKQKELEDVNKPEMTGEMYDEIHGLVEEGVSQFDFNDADNYEWEPEFDYDNKVVIGSIEMNDSSYIVESIMNQIDAHYKIIVKE
jgi:hypothetical protein